MADKNDEQKSRAVVSLISVGVVLVIGLPVWWNTTKVYRATLPHDDIQQLETLELYLKVGLTIIFENEEQIHNEFLKALLQKLNDNNSPTDDENSLVHISFNVDTRESTKDEKELLTSSVNDLQELDDSLQELWKPDGRKAEYKFIVLSQQGELSKLSPCFVGQYRHAVVLYDENQTLLADVIANVTNNVFVQRKVIVESFSHYNEKQSNISVQESIEQIRDLKSVTGFHLSFSLINDEPETGILNWNIQEAISKILQPLISKIPYFDISVDSQILHYSGVNLNPKTDGEIHYLTTEDLPHMINPIEGKLGSFVSLNPSLNFIVFVPPEKQTPLKIKDTDGAYSPTNAFLSPRWGGVLIHNVYNRSLANESTPPTITVDMTAIMKVFLMQIRLLAGVKPVSPQTGVIFSSVLKSGARDWEVDNLLLVKAIEYMCSSKKTLVSLTQLMDKVKNMIIDDHIKTKIEHAVLYIGECQYILGQGRISHAFMAAKMAIQLSEKAFYDPSVLELLYFPDDQKFAIYIPLFLPMALPLLLSLFATIKWLRSKDGDEQSKIKQSDAGLSINQTHIADQKVKDKKE